jgi:hypothetical protein
MLNQIAWEQMMFLGNPQFGCELQPIDFAKAAEAMGGHGFFDRGPCEPRECARCNLRATWARCNRRLSYPSRVDVRGPLSETHRERSRRRTLSAAAALSMATNGRDVYAPNEFVPRTADFGC